MINAIGHAIDANGGRIPSRQQVVHQFAQTKNFVGLAGTYAFTVDGDPARPTLQILQYQTGSGPPSPMSASGASSHAPKIKVSFL